MMVEWMLGGISALLIMCTIWIVRAIDRGSRRLSDAIRTAGKKLQQHPHEDPAAAALGHRLKEIQTARLAPTVRPVLLDRHNLTPV